MSKRGDLHSVILIVGTVAHDDDRERLRKGSGSDVLGRLGGKGNEQRLCACIISARPHRHDASASSNSRSACGGGTVGPILYRADDIDRISVVEIARNLRLSQRKWDEVAVVHAEICDEI